MRACNRRPGLDHVFIYYSASSGGGPGDSGDSSWLRLEHDQEDYEFASCMRFWYLFMLLVPGILHFSLHSFGYFRFPLENAERMENCP